MLHIGFYFNNVLKFHANVTKKSFGLCSILPVRSWLPFGSNLTMCDFKIIIWLVLHFTSGIFVTFWLQLSNVLYFHASVILR